MTDLRRLAILILFFGAVRAWPIILPEPEPQIDPARYGNVKTDAEARRNFLKAFTKAYMTGYKREFMERNKVKEDYFPSDMVELTLDSIDKMTPEEVMAVQDDGFRQLKKAMDDTVMVAYDYLIAGPKADKLRTELIAVLKTADLKRRTWQEESERKMAEAFKGIDAKIASIEKKLSIRLGNLESRAGIPPAEVPSDLSAASTRKTDRIMIFAALGLALLSLFATLFKGT